MFPSSSPEPLLWRLAHIFTCYTVFVTESRNVTLSLPEPLLRRFKVHAAMQNRSMSSLLTDAIAKLVQPEDDVERARRRLIERMRNAPGRGLTGKVPWTRDEIHER